MSNTEAGIVPRPVSEVPSFRYRSLEWFVFSFLILLAVPAALPPLFPYLTLLLAVPAILFIPLSFIVVPVLVYWDATLVRSLDIEWTPNAVRFAIIAFFLSPLMFLFAPIAAGISGLIQYGTSLSIGISTVGVHQQLLQVGPPIGALYYLYRRHKHISVSGTSQYWWVLLPIASLGGLGYLVIVNVVSTSVVFIPPIVAVFRMLFPVAAYMDALFLRNSQNSWNPNPAVQYLLAYISILVFPLSLLYLAYTVYHLGRRWHSRPV